MAPLLVSRSTGGQASALLRLTSLSICLGTGLGMLAPASAQSAEDAHRRAAAAAEHRRAEIVRERASRPAQPAPSRPIASPSRPDSGGSRPERPQRPSYQDRPDRGSGSSFHRPSGGNHSWRPSAPPRESYRDAYREGYRDANRDDRRRAYRPFYQAPAPTYYYETYVAPVPVAPSYVAPSYYEPGNAYVVPSYEVRPGYQPATMRGNTDATYPPSRDESTVYYESQGAYWGTNVERAVPAEVVVPPPAAAVAPPQPVAGPAPIVAYRQGHERFVVPPQRVRMVGGLPVTRATGNLYAGFGQYTTDAAAAPWLGLTAVSMPLADRLDEAQQRAMEQAMVQGTVMTSAPQQTAWQVGTARGQVRLLTQQTSMPSGECRMFSMNLAVGAESEEAWYILCRQGGARWEVQPMLPGDAAPGPAQVVAPAAGGVVRR